jgi:redox-sensitive bicupin YhaK (pirin superfamily)
VEDEEGAPTFSHYGAESLPAFEDEGVWGRLIAGEAWGLQSHVHTYSPMAYAHVRLATGASIQVPSDHSERAVYVASGTVTVDGQLFDAGRMVVLSPGAPVTVSASVQSTMMLLSGEPVGERFIEWNFVSSSKERIQQAKADWTAGRMKLPDLDNEEFIPLPSEPAPPNPMS